LVAGDFSGNGLFEVYLARVNLPGGTAVAVAMARVISR
jgi:hypothetical protein